ncbi:MAG: hypothetical protein PHR06_06490 [Candidatus Cloacimonetes bacterium]|nr:hypothetical protein [Candidatus Cloacimonadota bacterium]
MVISRDLSFLHGVRKDDFVSPQKTKSELTTQPEETQAQDKEVRTETQSANFSEIIVVVAVDSGRKLHASSNRE